MGQSIGIYLKIEGVPEEMLEDFLTTSFAAGVSESKLLEDISIAVSVLTEAGIENIEKAIDYNETEESDLLESYKGALKEIEKEDDEKMKNILLNGMLELAEKEGISTEVIALIEKGNEK